MKQWLKINHLFFCYSPHHFQSSHFESNQVTLFNRVFFLECFSHFLFGHLDYFASPNMIEKVIIFGCLLQFALGRNTPQQLRMTIFFVIYYNCLRVYIEIEIKFVLICVRNCPFFSFREANCDEFKMSRF